MQSDDTDRDGFAELLAAIQARTGMSDQAVAEAAGISRSQVWRWAHADSAPKYEPVRRLAAYLLAERPEVTEQASRLLSAAGYETPPEAPRRLPTLEALRSPEGEREYEHLAREVAAYKAALDAGLEVKAPWRNAQEAVVWAYESLREDERLQFIGALRWMAKSEGLGAERETGLNRRRTAGGGRELAVVSPALPDPVAVGTNRAQ